MQAYKASFTSALEAEHTEEWQLAEDRLRSWPQQRLKVPEEFREGAEYAGVGARGEGGGGGGSWAQRAM